LVGSVTTNLNIVPGLNDFTLQFKIASQGNFAASQLMQQIQDGNSIPMEVVGTLSRGFLPQTLSFDYSLMLPSGSEWPDLFGITIEESSFYNENGTWYLNAMAAQTTNLFPPGTPDGSLDVQLFTSDVYNMNSMANASAVYFIGESDVYWNLSAELDSELAAKDLKWLIDGDILNLVLRGAWNAIEDP